MGKIVQIKRNITTYTGSQAGVSLIETCLMVIVLGLLTVAGISLVKYKEEITYNRNNLEIIQTAQSALNDYMSVHGKLPCPAARNDGMDSDSGAYKFGVSIADDCTDASSLNWPATTQREGAEGRMVRMGALPVRTLGLPDKFMLDAWGSRLIYAVTEDFAAAGPAPVASKQGAIKILGDVGEDSTTDSDVGNISFVLLSYGSDKRGAYNLDGQMAEPCGDPTTTRGARNCVDPGPGGTMPPAEFVNMSSKSYNEAGGRVNTYTYDIAYQTNALGEYVWKVVPPYGNCSNLCGVGTRSVTVECQTASGARVDDALCADSGARPSNTETCDTGTCEWRVDTFGACNTTCGDGVRTRSITCITVPPPASSEVSRTVPDGYCGAARAPIQESCTEDTGCSYEWRYGDWSTCNNVCGGTQTRTATCYRIDTNAPVDNARCGGMPGTEAVSRECGDINNCGQCDNGSRNACAAGTANDGAIADTSTEFNWICQGLNGGSNSGICTKSKICIASNPLNYSISFDEVRHNGALRVYENDTGSTNDARYDYDIARGNGARYKSFELRTNAGYCADLGFTEYTATIPTSIMSDITGGGTIGVMAANGFGCYERKLESDISSTYRSGAASGQSVVKWSKPCGVAYHWQALNFAQCPDQCAGTTLTRGVNCLRDVDNVVVADSYCPGTKPDTLKNCPPNTSLCPVGVCDNTTVNGCAAPGIAYNTSQDTNYNYWQCLVEGGTASPQCAKPKACQLPPGDDGICDNSVQNRCTIGNANDAAIDDTSTHYKWRCDSTNGGNNSGECAMPKAATPQDGVCNNTVQNGCSIGSSFNPSEDNNNFYWNCQGVDGGNPSATCSIAKPTVCRDVSGDKLIDVYFLADNTGSMGPVIEAVRNRANYILNQLTGPGFDDIDFRFAVGNYQGDPAEGYGGGGCVDYDPDTGECIRGSSADEAPYTLQQDFVQNKISIKAAIDQWQAYGGGDRPEGNFYAFNQLATGASWRDNAGHILIWLGDAPAHTETVTEDQAISDLVSKGIAVVGLNSSTYDQGIDAADASYPAGQATRVVNATGGLLTSTASMDENALALYILNSIDVISDSLCGPTTTTPQTYSWVTGSFPGCTTQCYDSIQTRTVSCKRDSDGQTMPDSRCTSAKPAVQQVCPGDNSPPECADVCDPSIPSCGNEPPGGGCFTADTKILMADGTEKNIVDIDVGDMVMSFNKKDGYNSPLHAERVTHVFLENPSQTYVIHGTKVTDTHKFMTSSGVMKTIADMTEDDSIVMTHGTTVRRGQIKKGAIEPVYNFTVEHTHAYIADGKRVGNMTLTTTPPLPEGIYKEDWLKHQVIYMIDERDK